MAVYSVEGNRKSVKRLSTAETQQERQQVLKNMREHDEEIRQLNERIEASRSRTGGPKPADPVTS